MISKRPKVFADLDDTLFLSLRKLPAHAHEGKRLVSPADNGNDSYQTLKQQNLFAWLRETTDLIPVTARSTRAFAKIDLDFGNSFKIVANGAVIIKPDGKIDQDWHEILLAEITPLHESILEIEENCQNIARELGILVRCPQTLENGMRHSVIVKQDNLDVELRLQEIFERVDVPEDWTRHLNGNNMAFTVPAVSKKRAVEYVMQQLPDLDKTVTIGMGDSFTDMPFMSLCDLFVTPLQGQLADGISTLKHTGGKA